MGASPGLINYCGGSASANTATVLRRDVTRSIGSSKKRNIPRPTFALSGDPVTRKRANKLVLHRATMIPASGAEASAPRIQTIERQT